MFHHPDSRWGRHAGERIKDMYTGVKAAARRAKLPSSFVLHDLRHTRVTSWLAAGESAVLVQQAVGHSDLKTTMGYYSHVPGSHLATLNKSTALLTVEQDYQDQNDDEDDSRVLAAEIFKSG